MHRLGIDYGTKRIGLSYADELGVATPVPAILVSENNDPWTQLSDIVLQRKIQEIVIGYPIHMDGNIGKRAKEVDLFIDKLVSVVKLPVHKIDERLTTVQATADLEAMRIMKKPKTLKAHKKQRKSGQVDSVAASLILQEFLNQLES